MTREANDSSAADAVRLSLEPAHDRDPASDADAGRDVVDAVAHPIRVGRYLLFDSFASGGMAQVHVGRLIGPIGFSRVVAIKRLHPHLAREPRFVSMFVDEARLASRVRHPNVVSVIDLVSAPGELLLVMDYVPSESVSRLIQRLRSRQEQVPVQVAVAILIGALEGLHAAHGTLSHAGDDLGLVHRDVSPQNILVGEDGHARVVDFGIALAHERVQVTATGQLKGKLEYMPREQIFKHAVDRRTDVYAASVVLWELLTLRALFRAEHPSDLVKLIAQGAHDPVSSCRGDVSPELDRLVMRGLSLDAADRFQSAGEMAEALERCVGNLPPRDVKRWVMDICGSGLRRRSARVAQIESYDIETSEWAEGEVLGRLAPQADVAVQPGETLDYAASQISGHALTRVNAPDLGRGPPGALGYTARRPSASTAASALREPEVGTLATDVIAELSPTAGGEPAAPASLRRSAVWGAALAIALFGAGGLAIWAINRPDDVSAARHAAEQPEMAPLQPEGLEPRSAKAEVVELGDLVPEPVHSAASPSSTASQVSVSGRSAAPTPVAPRREKPPTTGGCSPPYTVDSKGVRVPKRECFE